MEYTLEELQFLSETGIDLHAWEKDEKLDEAAIKAREDIKKGEAYQKFLEAKKAYRTEKDPAKQAELIQACIDLLEEVIVEAEEMPADNIPEWLISFVIVNLKAIPAKLFWSIFGFSYTKIPISAHTTRNRFISELRDMQRKLQKELNKAEKNASKKSVNEACEKENNDAQNESAIEPINEGVIDVAKTLATKVKHLFKPGGKVEQKTDAPEARVNAMAKFADLEPKKVKNADDKDEEVPDKLAKKAADMSVSINPSGDSAVSPSRYMDYITDKNSVIDELGYIAASFYKSYHGPKTMYFFGTMNPDTAVFIGITKDDRVLVEKSPYSGPIVWALLKAANDKSVFSEKEIYGYRFIVEDDGKDGLDFSLGFKYEKMTKADALKYATDMLSYKNEN